MQADDMVLSADGYRSYRTLLLEVFAKDSDRRCHDYNLCQSIFPRHLSAVQMQIHIDIYMCYCEWITSGQPF